MSLSGAKSVGLLALPCFVAFSFTLVVIIRTLAVKVRTDDVIKCASSDADFIPLTQERLEKFRQVLRFQSISTDFHDYNGTELANIGNFITKGQFPRASLFMFCSILKPPIFEN